MTNSISRQFERALGTLCTNDRIRAVEAGIDHAVLWSEVDALGFTDALVPEAQGGAGLSLGQCGPLLVAAGRAGLGHPFGETMVARALLARAGHDPGQDCVALSRAAPRDDEAVVCREVPGAKLSRQVLVHWRGEWLLLPMAAVRQEPSSYRPNASATLYWESASQASARWDATGPSAATLCNAIYAAAMAGAMERVLDLSVRYAGDRRQFGRPIAQFQAVQQDLAVLAEQAASAAIAARIGCATDGLEPEELPAAVAKLRASEAALRVASLAHAVHGAIGITEEHVLGLFTTRLHEWRASAGTELTCARTIGGAALRSPEGFSEFMRAALAPTPLAED